MIFSLLIDEKIEVWKRTSVNVEADNLEDAIKECLEDNYTITDSEILYETEGLIDPDHYNGATKEIYLQDPNEYEPIYTNDPYKL